MKRPRFSPMPDDADSPPPETEAERRKHPRVPLGLLIQFRFDTFEDFLTEYATDISAGGMFIRTQSPREEGSMVYLQFALRDGPKIFEGLGRVVRVNPPEDPGRVAGMGVEFVNLDADSRQLIEEILAAKLPGEPAPA